MVPPKLPKLPDPENVFSVIDKAGDVIDKGLGIIDKVVDKFDHATDKFGPPGESSQAPTTATEEQKEQPPGQKSTPTQEPEAVATACVPCAVNHFSASAGLLKEAIRFKGDGITSNEVLDRIAMVLEEQNALERKDLTREQIQSLPPWEIELAEEALLQSRQLRHNLENLRNIEQLEKAAVDSERVYKKLFREWFKRRFAHLGPEKAQRISDEMGKLSQVTKPVGGREAPLELRRRLLRRGWVI